MYSLFFQSEILGGIERRMYHFSKEGKEEEKKMEIETVISIGEYCLWI